MTKAKKYWKGLAELNDNPLVDKLKQKSKPSITSDQMNKALKYVSTGGSIDAIMSKYKLTEQQEKQLHGNFKTANTKTTS